MVLKKADTILARFGEISLKSNKIRNRMINRLCENINAVLRERDLDGEVYNKWSRVFIKDFEDLSETVRAVTEVPGVVSASPCITVKPDIEEISAGLADMCEENFEGSTFGVDARRAGEKKDHDFSSPDIEERAGSAIMERVDGIEVDLDNPDQWFFVECRKEKAFLFMNKYRGASGLPVGTEGKVVSLISGGHDSPVAAYRMMRRGCQVIPVYFSFGEYSGVDLEIRTLKTIEALKKYAPNFDWDLRVVDMGEAMDVFMEELTNTRMVAIRRFMLKVAERIAEKEDARGIVTGESMGQKSSQTLGNLDLISRSVDIPVFRPLLSFDKSEIIDMARNLGTFSSSKIEAGCTDVAPARPEVSGDTEKVLRMEPDNIDRMVEKAVDKISLREV